MRTHLPFLMPALILSFGLLYPGPLAMAQSTNQDAVPLCQTQAKPLARSFRKIEAELAKRNKASYARDQVSDPALSGQLRNMDGLGAYLSCLTANMQDAK